MSVPTHPPKPPVAPLALTDHDALPAGTRFGEFEIIRSLGVGGFGIVYLAQDHSLERQVALKEYMPATLAARGDGPLITVRSRAFAETYANGLKSFINEARLLARFDHPSLVKVYRFWEGNGTAYMVMPYLQGQTLREARRWIGGAPGEAWIRGVLDPLLDALALLHAEGVYHRDIAPDNIVLPPGGPPVLLDFGAARRVIGDASQSLTAILKPSYAPIEQYADMDKLRQGPWTDLYALGAVLHFLLFAAPPSPATARAVQADAEPIGMRVVPGVSSHFVRVVEWMLRVRPAERPQDVAALRAVLDGAAAVPEAVTHEVTRPWVGPVSAPMPGGSATQPVFARTAVDQPTLASGPPALPRTKNAAEADTLPDVSLWRAGAAEASPDRVAEPVVAARRRGGRWWSVAGMACALAVALGMLWQFAGLARPPSALESAHAVPVEAAAVTVPAPPPTPVAAVAKVAAVAAVAAASVPPVESRDASPVAAASPEASPDPVAASPVARQARRAAPAPRPERALASGALTARAACGDRSFFALAMCLDRQCERPRFRDDPQCERILAMKRRRSGEY